MKEKINDLIKNSMRSKDALGLNVYRGILAAFTNELVAKGRTPQDTLSPDESLAVIRRLAKQRKDSIEQFEKGGRNDLAQNEKAELAVIETLLPKSLPEEQILAVAKAKQSELKISDKSKVGMLIGAVLKELKGQASGDDVKKVVDKLF